MKVTIPEKRMSFILIFATINLVSVSALGQISFSDCFESGNLTSENWTTTGSSVISTDNPQEGTFCMKGAGTYRIEQNYQNITDEIVTTEFYMKSSQTGSVSVNFRIQDVNDNHSVSLAFSNLGIIGAHNGTKGFEVFLTYSADVWYKIKVVLDNSAKTFDVYIDDILMADDYSFFSSGFISPTKFLWTSGETWGTGWIDCVSINSNVTGIKSHRLTPAIKSYPNPTNGQVHIKLPIQETVSVSVFNVLGEEIQTTTYRESEFKVDLGEFQSGMYFLVVKKLNGEILSANKVLKQ